ncbi:Dephospho-CoA kinase [Limihaloglobus sulfuriphilus]|uniref:Dephospho-CoA kinase n=1 Tax=Limihaloglobus sulfuriphilus TaxID=1851148 RepID=A0A1Q2MBB3_9BACT|nr:dephospho-CoA kinase [Limihaloglobus sulfuriphilus]AQQ69964.1 Dephospho-CoA kinase [Limihaloglobus sulfuriphilus]
MSGKPYIGITGGIGSGKSFVAALFAELGCGVIDADRIVSDLYKSGQLNADLVKLFGTEAVNDDKSINRKHIASVVFEKPEKLKQLNALVHPLVISESKRLSSLLSKDNSVKAVIFDVPLLLETGMDSMCDFLVYVETPLRLRLERLKKRGIKSEEQLKKREKYQISLDIKKKNAKYVVINSSYEQARRQVYAIFTEILDSGN